jgi:hypothetical protein
VKSIASSLAIRSGSIALHFPSCFNLKSRRSENYKRRQNVRTYHDVACAGADHNLTGFNPYTQSRVSFPSIWNKGVALCFLESFELFVSQIPNASVMFPAKSNFI